MSVSAVSWALYRAPTKSHSQRLVLIYLADHTDRDGRGAYPSAATVGRDLGMSERSVYRHTADLEEAGLIELGDQQLVSHIRADRRPSVWNLNMAIVQPEPEEDRAGPGRTRPANRDTPSSRSDLSSVTPREAERPVTDDTPPAPDGVSSTAPRGVIHGVHGVSPVTPKPSTEPKDEPKPPPPVERERPAVRATASGGGGGTPEVLAVVAAVGEAWRRPAAALARHGPTVASALSAGWQPDALARHLGDAPPPVIEDAARLLGHRLRLLPAPGECGRRCCAGEQPVRPATCITCRVPLDPGEECAYCAGLAEVNQRANEQADAEQRRAGTERRERISAAIAELGPDAVRAIVGRRDIDGTKAAFARARLGAWLDEHEWDLDAARNHARSAS